MKQFMILPVYTKNDANVSCYLIENNPIVRGRLEELSKIRNNFEFDFLVELNTTTELTPYVYLLPNMELIILNDKVYDSLDFSKLTYIYLTDDEIDSLKSFCKMSQTKLYVTLNNSFYLIEYDFEYDYIESLMFDISDF